MNISNMQIDDDDLIASVYDIGFQKPSFLRNFNTFMQQNKYGVGPTIYGRTMLYSKSGSVPLLNNYVEGWYYHMTYEFIHFGWPRRGYNEKFEFQSAFIYGPGNIPKWLLQDVVDEILKKVTDVTEIWLCSINNFQNTAIVVVNKDGFYDIFANSNDDELDDSDKCILHRLKVIKKKYTHSSERTIGWIKIVEEGQYKMNLHPEDREVLTERNPNPTDIDSTMLYFAFPNPTDVGCAMLYFDNPPVHNSGKFESNGVISYSLKRASLIRGAPLVLTRFLIRANDDRRYYGLSRSNPILKRLYFAFAKRRWLTFLNATRTIAENAAHPESIGFAGSMGRFKGISNQDPFSSYNDCMEYKSNRHLLRFAQEFNKAKGLPPPEIGDDDEWRSRICADLSRKNLHTEEEFLHKNADSFSSGTIKKPITNNLKERLQKREKDRMRKQRIYNHLEKGKSVLVLCQRKESLNDKSIKESVIPKLEYIIEDFLKISDTENVDIKYMVNLENPDNDKSDFNMILDKSDSNANEFIKNHKDFYDLIVLQTCPDYIMDLGFIYYILKTKGHILITKVDYNGEINILETSEYNNIIKKYTEFGFTPIQDDNFIVFQKNK